MGIILMKHAILHGVEVTTIIALLYLLVIQPINQTNEPQFPSISVSFQEPPKIAEIPINLGVLINDLRNLSCTIINATGYNTIFTTGPQVRVNYMEFRRAAYNTKIVFVGYDQKDGYTKLLTSINTIQIVCNLKLQP